MNFGLPSDCCKRHLQLPADLGELEFAFGSMGLKTRRSESGRILLRILRVLRERDRVWAGVGELAKVAKAAKEGRVGWRWQTRAASGPKRLITGECTEFAIAVSILKVQAGVRRQWKEDLIGMPALAPARMPAVGTCELGNITQEPRPAPGRLLRASM
jgi:hypothetical protein